MLGGFVSSIISRILVNEFVFTFFLAFLCSKYHVPISIYDITLESYTGPVHVVIIAVIH